LKYFAQAKAGDERNGINRSTSERKPGGAAATGKNPDAAASTLGPDMTITGNIVCEGSARIFGRVIGDIQATEVLIGEGAHVEGNLTAHDVSITGVFKGTVRANTVRLQGSASIDGEVFSKSLTVEENVQFEGISRRLDKPVELAVQAEAQIQANGGTPAPATMADTASNSPAIV
jgi:cytoskeletal protein CcmA (bactofilin family)